MHKYTDSGVNKNDKAVHFIKKKKAKFQYYECNSSNYKT